MRFEIRALKQDSGEVKWEATCVTSTDDLLNHELAKGGSSVPLYIYHRLRAMIEREGAKAPENVWRWRDDSSGQEIFSMVGA